MTDSTHHPFLDELQARIRAAASSRTPLRLRGGGSKDFHGQALQGELLELAGLNGILSYEPTELVITARAGTPLAELEAAVAEQGQALAFEPPHFGSHATLGGMVATGWSGPARASVGAVRDFVLGAEMINGKGELLRYGGQVMKNVAGYDVSRLLAGSWGTLGVMTEISLKVLPIAPAEAILRFELAQQPALDALNRWGSQPLPLNASAWHDGQLWLRLRGAQAAVSAACQQLGGEAIAPAQAQTLWHSLREQQHDWFSTHAKAGADACLWRLSVPQTAPALALPEAASSPLVEWHGGQRWVYAPRSAAEELQASAQAAGGHATLWRAEAGQPLSASPIFAPTSASLQRIHQQLKAAFDPHGIFNPGRTGL